MRGRSPLLTVVLLVSLSASSQARVIHVPTDFATIQSGINDGADGDTVLVHPGLYVENIDFLGKAIVLMSAGGPDSTVIDGNRAGSVVTFRSGEDANSVIEGFTVTNGSGTYYDVNWEYVGGGIYCDGAAPTIQYNSITGNTANNGGGIAAAFTSAPIIRHNQVFQNSAHPSPGHIGGGGGIAVAFDSSPEVTHNDIYGNVSGVAGGGIACGFDSNPMVVGNTIRDNVAEVYGGGIQIYSYTAGTFAENSVIGNTSLGDNGAGGISCRLGSTPLLANNLVTDNSAATYGGGIRCFDEAAPTIENNLVFGNEADISGGGIECDCGASATVRNTILWSNQAPAGTELWVGPRTGAPPSLMISYSDVEGGMGSVHVDPGSTLNWGPGMMEDDPLLRAPEVGDFHLAATVCGDSVDSPCIDAGDPTVADSLLDCAHGLGTARSDIGAYGGGGEGSPSSIEVADDGQEQDNAAWPQSFQMFQSYPNPLSTPTTIAFDLLPITSQEQHVRIAIYDTRGRRVKTLLDSQLAAGPCSVVWDGLDDGGYPLACGVYFFTLRGGDRLLCRKVAIMR